MAERAARIIYSEDGASKSRDARVLHAALAALHFDTVIAGNAVDDKPFDVQFSVGEPAEGCVTVDEDFKTIVGWTSFDMLDERVPRERSFLHVAGKSARKGTEALVRVWKPEWPLLTIIACPPLTDGKPWYETEASNVRIILGQVSDGHLRELHNRSLFHVYPKTNGFCHAAWEGLSCGAVILSRSEATITPMVEQMIKIEDEQLASICASARKAWEKNNDEFQTSLGKWLESNIPEVK